MGLSLKMEIGLKLNLTQKQTEQEQIIQELKGFTGTEAYHRASLFGNSVLTDGMNYLRNRLNCFWLVDIVASVQHLKKIQEEKNFIVWLIEVKKDKSFIVTTWNDTPYKSEKLYEQEGKYTDFLLDRFEFYQEGEVLLLKSEH